MSLSTASSVVLPVIGFIAAYLWASRKRFQNKKALTRRIVWETILERQRQHEIIWELSVAIKSGIGLNKVGAAFDFFVQSGKLQPYNDSNRAPHRLYRVVKEGS